MIYIQIWAKKAKLLTSSRQALLSTWLIFFLLTTDYFTSNPRQLLEVIKKSQERMTFSYPYSLLSGSVGF